MKYIIIDCESSGLPPKGATYDNDYKIFPRILSLAWKFVKDGQESQTYSYFINQEGFKIPLEATKINGITDEMCNESKFNIFSVLIQLMMDMGTDTDFVIGYNLYFDSSLIKASVLRIVDGGKTPITMYEQFTNLLHKDKRIDVMRSCAKLFGGKWPTLSESYTRLFQESFNAHSAGSDVDATYRILQELIRLNAIKIILPEKVVQEVVDKVVVEEEI